MTTPVSIGEAIRAIGETPTSKLSLSVRPVSRFICDDLMTNNILKKSNGGYVLSQRGDKEKVALEKIVNQHVFV